ncbi:HTH-type transcriptional regulator PrtR [Citrobacter freundii]|uniref:Helix-turn-helix transcriptional regulator n=1 Tax=Citrobacter portucalensis TaxID=1639133 RepID=A0A9X4GLL3_9ENTR|nr:MULTISPECIES: helix-turn-helix transcriptional regulator [Citrobacter freundii complex]MDU2466978.1 helix-turn-helix transcriptional regulator [Veillonella sp.]MDE9583690.1 helix-turn-helix transcriptional regulator [Citrobacter braakii]MDE9621567.1 helix-turn-helix transcriptional regulator [Citrobacter portucalensis]MDV1744518.1 helix-turn-helix transcriptional regulator [Citrobacter freundii]MEB0442297.1 helix-turn-helix transcriptional regulator [Citrobacter freundii]
MKTFAERLIAAMTAAGLSQGQLAERVGLSQPAIQKMTSGKTNGSRKMVELSRALSVRPEWLSAGSGPMRNEDNIPPEKEWGKIDSWDRNTPLPEDEVEIPFLRDIEFACGDGRVSDEDYNGFKLRFSKATLRKVGANTDGSGVLCFPARGNSMEPNIPDGTTVAVNTKDKKIVDGKMYAINEDGWKRIKLLYRTGPEMISIRSYNSAEYPSEDKNLGDIEIIGRVFWWSVLDY